MRRMGGLLINGQQYKWFKLFNSRIRHLTTDGINSVCGYIRETNDSFLLEFDINREAIPCLYCTKKFSKIIIQDTDLVKRIVKKCLT